MAEVHSFDIQDFVSFPVAILLHSADQQALFWNMLLRQSPYVRGLQMSKQAVWRELSTGQMAQLEPEAWDLTIPLGLL